MLTTSTDELKDAGAEENGKAEVFEQLSPEDAATLPVVEEMMKAGLMYGRKRSFTNPKMKSYIFAIRGGMAVFDLSKTLKALETALEAVKKAVKGGGKVLVVGTQPAAKELVKAFAKDHGQYFVTERWLGGTLTNFKTISSRVEHFKKLKSDKAAGRLEKYTKKERVGMDKEIEDMGELFGGFEDMTVLPAMVLLVNATLHDTALREARRMKIPVVALMSSDGNPDFVQYPIPGNASARPSIAWVLEKIGKAIEEGKKA